MLSVLLPNHFHLSRLRFNRQNVTLICMTGFLINTSSDHIFCAITSKGSFLIKEIIPKGKQHSYELFSCVQKTLAKQNLSIEDIDFIGVGIGPGSYIGTRAGVSAAKALAYGRNIPLISFSSLLAWKQPPFPFLLSMASKKGDFCVLEGADENAYKIHTGVSKNSLLEMLSQEISHTETSDTLPYDYEAAASYCYKKFLEEREQKNYIPELVYLSSP